MVRKLSNEYKESISSAIMEAERATDAEIAVVVAPASDGYQSYIFLFGLAFGSLLASILWAGNILAAFPLLLAMQFGIIALFSFTPPIRYFCMRFVPRQILHHRAAHQAFGEYISASQNVPASIPLVVFYVSLAEHYAHILPSRIVREKIPDTIWASIIKEFTSAIPKLGVQNACTNTITHITKLLAPHFPARGDANYLSDQVIEKK